jgi:putative glutamine amidotransferase
MPASKPFIGITISSEEHPSWRQFAEAVSGAGGEPLPLVASQPYKLLKQDLQGIVLGGGGDIHPMFFKAPEELPPRGLCLCRDEFELDLCWEALNRNIPLLGVCRGLQVLVVAAGGSLHQHLPDAIPQHLAHEAPTPEGQALHEVRLQPGSKLMEIFGEASLTVNSTHHQAAKDLRGGLVSSAYSDDGVIEAVELPAADFILGVQWHPERILDSHPIQSRLFEKLVEAARLP